MRNHVPKRRARRLNSSIIFVLYSCYSHRLSSQFLTTKLPHVASILNFYIKSGATALLKQVRQGVAIVGLAQALEERINNSIAALADFVSCCDPFQRLVKQVWIPRQGRFNQTHQVVFSEALLLPPCKTGRYVRQESRFDRYSTCPEIIIRS